LGGGYAPRVELSGDFGVIAWSKKGGIFTARSGDGGASWSTGKKVVSGTSFADDVALSGQRAIVTGAKDLTSADPAAGSGVRLTSADAGASWVSSQSYPAGGDGRLAVFVEVPGAGERLAEAWLDSTAPNWPWPIEFHREQ
jgi:hypothetical protein